MALSMLHGRRKFALAVVGMLTIWIIFTFSIYESSIEAKLSRSDKVKNSERTVQSKEPHTDKSDTLWTLQVNETVINSPSPQKEHVSSLSAVFPKVIHMTLKSKIHISPNVRSNIDSFRRLNPDYEIRLYDDDDIRKMVKEHRPHMLDMFDSFGKSVERADFWRYLVMYVEGGVYADTDVECIKPIDRWTEVFGDDKEHVNAVIGIEADLENEEERKRQGFVSTVQFCQWTFMSKPDHVLFNQTMNAIFDLVQREKANTVTLEGDQDWRIIQRTGPGIFTRTVEQFLKDQQLTSKQVNTGFKVVNDVGVLPVHGFGYRPGVDPYPQNYDRDICVSHHFFGVWKGEQK
jgi:mannosyltransferase OCH1-like enzyme